MQWESNVLLKWLQNKSLLFLLLQARLNDVDLMISLGEYDMSRLVESVTSSDKLHGMLQGAGSSNGSIPSRKVHFRQNRSLCMLSLDFVELALD